LITDGSGPISMAGTMGGLSTEIDGTSTDLVIEAAHFDARGTAKMSRRHKLHSEASYRFERGVDRELPLRASAKAVALLSGLGEEVSRLEGYEKIPVRMPRALAGRGLTPRQRLCRSAGRTLAESGYVEILSSPFGSRSDADRLGLPPEDMRRPAVVVANPL